MTEVHFYDFVTSTTFPGIDAVEFPEAPSVGDSIELLPHVPYVVRNRVWVMSKKGKIQCRVFVVKQ